MKVLFCAAEMAPLVKVGGLGETAGSLTQVLTLRGHDVRAIVPLYGCIDRLRHGVEPTDVTYDVLIGGKKEPVKLWEARLGVDVLVYLVEHEGYFGGPQVYTPHDLDRFYYFSRASLELLRYADWRPDILHCHDWHTGAAVSHLKSDFRGDPLYSPVASVFTIHNLAYQGAFDYQWAMARGIVGHIPPRGHPLHPLLWRMMALGIYHADVVSTVSESYAREILTPGYGEGLDAVLRHRQGQLYGMVSGIDYGEYNPTTDPLLSTNYRLSSVGNRQKLKQALQAEVGLPESPDVPLLGYVGRLSRQKGVPLLVQGVEPLMLRRGVQLVTLGQAPEGEEVYAEMLRLLEARHPQQMKVITRYDQALARRIYASCDLLVMPSLYEPCGLSQLIALRYGAVPVVRHTGGLIDTVLEHPIMGNGFVFHDARDGSDLEKALERALIFFRNKEQWRRLVIRAMSSDVSWERACQRYEEMYQRALEIHARTS